ncbi:Rod shape-determining protein MreC [Oceanobacillus picturae]|jgi:rod shape-determining protein MreC|uniref:Cell shape-determining protein MreC n=1 Tax=Oceanobacillus picturae TaxID=171693 RepID=W9A7I3_9BACI|nr:rod shape-determining protein MreC [Oceanobacillus picturae]RIU93676.1 rod shape-determining protein MreC [Oceanobacillus picturae]CDO01739.1 Rod shape-determining protein MreC [Oceanobacillus picturae]
MSFLRRRKLFIFLIGFIVLVALIGFSLRDRANLTIAEQFVLDTVGFAQKVVHTPVNFITDIFTNIDDFRDTYTENQVLKEKLAEYKGLIYEVQGLKAENEELREIADLKESDQLRNFTPIQASVMSRSPERWVEQVTINKGKDDGVAENMAVITPDGMIGKILTTSSSTAKVQLLTGFDQFNRISASVSREDGDKDIRGMIEEYDEESGSLLFRIIEESDKDLKEGELVFSSGLGGVFPSGLPIGEVKEVVPDQYGLTRTALVEPAADMYDINQVIVVDRAMDEEEDTADSEEEAE